MAHRIDNFARAKNNIPLTDDQIRRVAPSIFAEAPHGSRSEKYAYIATSVILQALRRDGFEVFMAGQANARDDDRREHAKHMLRLRHVGAEGRRLEVGDSTGEIVLINSHDGSCSYRMSAGLYRLVCSNGLMVSESELGSVKVPHKGDVKDDVVQGAYDILDGFTKVVESKGDMESITLNEQERELFARSALPLRFAMQNGVAAPITESQALRPHRAADNRNDLWTVFNRVQENLIKGGMVGRNATGKRTSVRAVRGIDSDVRVNQALWTLAQGMMELKKGKQITDTIAA